MENQNKTLQDLMKELEAIRRREKEIAVEIRNLYTKAGVKL